MNNRDVLILHPVSDWHEDFGDVIWWHLPVCEPPYIGTLNDLENRIGLMPSTVPRLVDSGWLTHWSFLPDARKMTTTDGAEVNPNV